LTLNLGLARLKGEKTGSTVRNAIIPDRWFLGEKKARRYGRLSIATRKNRDGRNWRGGTGPPHGKNVVLLLGKIGGGDVGAVNGCRGKLNWGSARHIVKNGGKGG